MCRLLPPRRAAPPPPRGPARRRGDIMRLHRAHAFSPGLDVPARLMLQLRAAAAPRIVL
jgi:hypothetical protein